MAFERLAFEKTWESAEDFPTYQDSEAQVRADLQYHPNAIRAFLNALLDTLEASGGASIAVATADASGTINEVLDQHLARMNELDEDIQTVAAGGVPSVSRCSRVDFAQSDWESDEEGEGAVLTVSQTDHNRSSAAFGFALWQTVDGLSVSDTWAVLGTSVRYDEETGNIVLWAEEAYDGHGVFFGV